jgi:hypothetical protein
MMAMFYQRVTDCCSVLVFFRQRLDVPYPPGTVTNLPFERFDLPQKLGRDCRFAPEALVSRIAPQAQVHVTCSCLKGSPEDTQLLFVEFE